MATFGTFTVGQVLTAAELNAAGTYTSYTPTFSGFTLGNGTINYAKYTKFNKLVHTWGQVTLGGSSVMTGPLDISLPVTAVGPVLTAGGNCSFYNNVTLFWGQIIHLSTGFLRLVAMNASGTYAYNSDLGAAIPFSWGNTHTFRWNHTYEAA